MHEEREESMHFERVEPIQPLAGYVGGKKNLAGRIVPLIEAQPHDLYAEVFMGMGGIFFRRQRVPKAEVINDASKDVATLFRVLQRHYVAFMEMMRLQLTTRAEFERLVRTDPATLTDLERSARFIYLQRTAFGSKVVSRTFGVQRAAPARFDIIKLAPMIEDVHARLVRVVIECLDWSEFLARYDAPGTLFYLDPPYWGSEGYYGKELFGRQDFARLAEQLRGIKGNFILSINDTKGVRETFSGFTMKAVKTTYTLAGGGKAKTSGELIITGR